MRRVVLTLLASLLAVAGAGCGVGDAGSGSSGAPDPSELARDAFRAARDAGSVRYELEASLAAEGQPPMRLSVSGAIGGQRVKADVSFDGGGQALAGSLLIDRGSFFIRFLDRWYGENLPVAQAQDLNESFGTENAFEASFDEVFEGSISDGPVADGVPTWAYHGRLNADGLLELMAKEESLDDESRKQVEELAESTRFTFLVGKVDSLPRAYRLDLSGDGIDFGGFAGQSPGVVSITMRGSFAGWGEPVTITPPHSYAPLDELFGQFFGS